MLDPMITAATGIEGLDEILAGGLSRGSLFLLEGEPGTGKTTIALQFLMDGARRGEKCLYITLSETPDELRQGAASHGWELDEHIEVFELIPPESILSDEHQQSLLYASDLELVETTKQIFATVDRAKASRVVIDSLSEIRLLAQSSLRYRRQILAIKHYFARHSATVLLLDDLTSEAADKTVHSVAQGVIRLEEIAPEYGAERRRLRVMKYRGQKFRGGFHDFVIKTGGIGVFPRLVSAEHRNRFERRVLSAGIPELDALLGGGVNAGSSTLILGPAGTGKSLVAMTFVMAALTRGEKAALFLFDEELGLLFDRMLGLGIDLEKWQAEGKLFVNQIDAAELSPGEFSHRVCQIVNTQDIKTVVIDSLNGYRASMPEENSLILHIHELLQYLNRHGAATFMTVAQHGLVGDMKTPVDVTYLADTVILLRYFEAIGEVRRAISIIKKRTGRHEPTIREFGIGEDGLTIGEPLTDFHGVLRGVPTYSGSGNPLLQRKPS
ncbi:ATPase domain-containing protein [Emcibacter sp. SYSU 3D8]|uniref:ATPase domain-containing protein n=1 Tax=Emcibacter sp. SYSU 3D8 TaxID=3133969 RepID=UPI0031FE4EA7